MLILNLPCPSLAPSSTWEKTQYLLQYYYGTEPDFNSCTKEELQLPRVIVEAAFHEDESRLVDFLVFLLAVPRLFHFVRYRIFDDLEGGLRHVLVNHVVDRALDHVANVGQRTRG